MERNSSPRRAWARAVREALGAPQGAMGVAALLGEAVRMSGASAGAVLDAAGRVRNAARRSPHEMSGLLAGSASAAALERLASEGEEEALLDSGRLLLVSLRVRELRTGWLLLHFPDAPPPVPVREAAAAFAATIALLEENTRLQDEARQALQVREHFLTALNHELRTPANALILTADLLRTGALGELPPRLASAVEEAETNVRMMIAVLRRVLDLGQLGHQAAPERSDVLHPREAVAALLRRMEPAAKRKNLALALYVPRTLPPIQTDPDRFERILLHLLSNAVRFTTEGGVDVRLERSHRHLGPHRREPVLVVRVTDTGCGIPPEQMERVFEPFTQVEEGARTDSGRRGVGLGLPLARQLARSLRGDIVLESTPGHGTSASLILPYHSVV